MECIPVIPQQSAWRNVQHPTLNSRLSSLRSGGFEGFPRLQRVEHTALKRITLELALNAGSPEFLIGEGLGIDAFALAFSLEQDLRGQNNEQFLPDLSFALASEQDPQTRNVSQEGHLLRPLVINGPDQPADQDRLPALDGHGRGRGALGDCRHIPSFRTGVL